MTEQRSGQQWIIKVNGAEQMDVKPGESLEIGRKPLRPLADDGHRRFEVVDEARSMSKRHALLTVHDDGTAAVRDLHSTNGSYMIREDGELTRLQAEVDFTLPYSPIRLQFGDIPVDFIRVDAPEHSEPAVTDLFSYARDGASQEPDPADMSVDDILNLRAGEPTAMFSSQNVADRLRQLRDASLQVPRLAGTEPADDEPQHADGEPGPALQSQPGQPSDAQTPVRPEPQDTVPVVQRQSALQQATAAEQQPTPRTGDSDAQPNTPTRPAAQPTTSAKPTQGVPQGAASQSEPASQSAPESRPAPARSQFTAAVLPDAVATATQQRQFAQEHPIQELPLVVQPGAPAETGPRDLFADAEEHSKELAQLREQQLKQEQQDELQRQERAQREETERQEQLHARSAEPALPVEPEQSGKPALPERPAQSAPEAAHAEPAQAVRPSQQSTGEDYSRFVRPVTPDPAANSADNQTVAGQSAQQAPQTQQPQQIQAPQTQPVGFKPVFEPGSVFERVSRGDFDHKEPQVEAGGFTSQQARTTTDYTVQFQIARHAQLLPFLAMNPTLYDDLYAWLAAQGNADVDAALAHNQGYQEYREAVGK